MPSETLATKLKRYPMLTLFLMMLMGFCLLVITGLFAPEALALLRVIDAHGVTGMHWTHAVVVIWAALYGVLGFFFYLAFKVLEKVVIDDLLTSLPKPKNENQEADLAAIHGGVRSTQANDM